jgi:triacylglycerol lipase
MGAAQYVGRVGGLALALGLGTAVFTGNGVASAAPNSGGSSSESSVSTSSTSGPVDTGAQTSSGPTASESTPTGEAASAAATTSSGSSSSTPSRSTRRKYGSTVATAAPSASTSRTVHGRSGIDDTTPRGKGSVSGPGSSAATSTATSPRTTSTEETEGAASSSAAAATTQTAPQAEPIAPAEALQRVSMRIATLISDVLDTSAFGGDKPGIPAEPAAWILLSHARRELEGTLSTGIPSPKTAGSATTNGIVANTTTLNQDIAASNVTQVNLPAATQLSAIPGAERPVFVGQPSLVSDALVAVLRIAHDVLSLFGVENVPPAQLPIFSDGTPPFFVTLGLNVQRTEFDGMPVYTLQQPGSTSEEVVVGLHGGAYVGQISLFQWWTYADIARDTGATVVVPIYPLAPEGTASVVVPKMADFLSELIDQHGSENVSLLGDSAGGGLALAAVQELVRRGSATPGRMVLLGPWLDATVSDPESQTIQDPILDAGVLRDAGVLWAGGLNPADPLVSPLNGSLSGLPPTWVYTSSLDLLAPQTLRLREQALAEGLTNFTFVFREGEIHVWPTYPFLPEAAADLPAIETELLGTDVVQPDLFRELVALIQGLLAL